MRASGLAICVTLGLVLKSIATTAVLFGLVACSSSEPTATWQQITDGEPSALLAVWGTRSDDVWAVGGRDQNASPIILHYDGVAWSKVDSQQTNLDLWWVTGTSSGDLVLMSGSGGTILRYDGAEFQKLLTPNTTGTIYGMWAAASNDIWAVGDLGAAGAAVWHSTDGQTFQEVEIPAPAPTRVFKVHGRASDDVWMSCNGGVTLHWNGSQLTSEPTPTTNPLFSIVTTPDVAVTVGGTGGAGDLYENDGGGWTSAGPMVPVAWRGTAAIDTDIVVVGEAGLVARRDGASWDVLPQDLTIRNFHSAWLDEEHGLWAVGGLFDGELSDGMLLYYGPQTIEEVTP